MLERFTIAAIALAALAFLTWLWWLRRRLVIVTVRGASMEPTLINGDRIVARRVRTSALKVGQIVVVEQPVRRGRWEWLQAKGGLTSRDWMIKRIAALPGDPVPTHLASLPGARPGQLVPADSLLLLGDNKGFSTDSRHIGYVPIDRALAVMLRPLLQGSGKSRASTSGSALDHV
ncbi:S26 family signal peptidase [Micromonospora aurantiaca]